MNTFDNMKKYKLYNSFGHIIRAWSEANCFRIVINRPDFDRINKKLTKTFLNFN